VHHNSDMTYEANSKILHYIFVSMPSSIQEQSLMKHLYWW